MTDHLERAGLRRVPPTHPADTPLYTLDSARLEELVRERDEAVALVEAARKMLRTTFGSRAGFAHTANEWVQSAEPFLAALDREVPK